MVIELKRTNDGGHMDLQAIRYASMVSTMTLGRAVEIHAAFLEQIGQPSAEAESRILEFLGWEGSDEESFADDVRIFLVSEDFGKELTTAVLWLRDRDIDIRCVRLRPYRHAESTFIDVQQIIPLPEANEYQVQVREKEQQGRKSKSDKHATSLRFWTQLVALCRQQGKRHGGRKPSAYNYLSAVSGVPGLNFNYVVTRDDSSTELYIDVGDEARNKGIFDRLVAQRAQIENAFGGALTWERLERRRACRIKQEINAGGLQSTESEWHALHQAMIDTMSRLETALRPALDSLSL